MLRRISALVTFAALTVGVALPAAATPPTQDFAGVWTSVDVFDGSNQVLVLTPTRGNRMSVILFDDGASVCGGSPLTPVLAWGTGRVTGTTLTVALTLYCFNGTPAPDATVVFTHNSAADTLIDNFGTTWNRA